MSIDTKTLRRFCSPQDDRFPDLFGLAHGTAACNGNVLVWIPEARCYAPLTDPEHRERLEQAVSVAHVASSNPAGTWTRVVAIQFETYDCWRCHGFGYTVEPVCPECNGVGHFRHGRNDYECSECNGRGFVVTAVRADTGSICNACMGSGINGGVSDFEIAGHSGLTVNRVYAKLLRELPMAALRHEPVTFDTGGGPYLVGHFDGGVFMLAPYKAPPQFMPGSRRVEGGAA